MTRAGASIFYFAFWILICGIFLFFVPDFSLNLAGMPVSDVTVPRLFGMVLVFLSIYYFLAGRRPEFWPLYRVTVYTRASALIIVIVLVLLDIVRPLVIAFVAVDALGALWTGISLKADKNAGLCTAYRQAREEKFE